MVSSIAVAVVLCVAAAAALSTNADDAADAGYETMLRLRCHPSPFLALALRGGGCGPGGCV